jgi:hypothetical protein
MSDLQQRKGGKNITTSPHRKERYAFYRANTYAKNKLKRILMSSEIEARRWAKDHLAMNILQRLMKG